MDLMVKRAIVVLLATLFAAISSNAIAGNEAQATNAAPQSQSAPVELSDAELDGVTAAGIAFLELVYFNQRKFSFQTMGSNYFVCINCQPQETPNGAWGFLNVLTTRGRVISLPIGRPPF